MSAVYDDSEADEVGSCSIFGKKRQQEIMQKHHPVGGGGRGYVDPDEQELAREMNELSVKERERVLDDIQ